MATTVDTLLVRIQSDMSELRRDLKKIETQTKTSTNKVSSSFKMMALAIKGTIAAVGVALITNLGKKMVSMASDAEESTSKARVVFGKNFGAVEKELDEFGNAVGRATIDLVTMASSVQDTFVPMGFAREDASKLSVQLSKLAVDVASFNNASDADTMRAFQSAIVGNHETVRRFGVVITEATLKQELMRMGINKSMKEVTNAEKVQARLNLIIDGTSDAHGDATETAHSFANESKALGSALKELSNEITADLLPALAKLVGFLTKVIERQKELRAENKKVFEKTQLEILEAYKKQLDGINKSLEDGIFIFSSKEQHLETKAHLESQIKLFEEMLDINKKITEEMRERHLEEGVETKRKLKSFQDLRVGNTTAGQSIHSQGRPDFVPKPSTDPSVLKEFKKNLEAIRIARIRGQSSQGEAFVAMIEEAKFEEEFSRQRKTNQEEFFEDTKKFTDGSIKLSQARVNALTEEFKNQKAIREQLTDVSIRGFDKMENAMLDFADGTTKGFDGIRDSMRFFIKDLQRTMLRMLVFNKIKNAIFGTSFATANMGDIGSNIMGMFGGGGGGGTFGASDSFAKGGTMQKGRPYLVGERGAELFVPNTGGTLMNNMNTRNMGGGATIVNQTINVETGVAPTVRAEIMNLLPSIKRDTISSLIEAKKRGGNIATAFA